MKRKKSSGGGGANWMDTYGDMVTLLLCFFVLLYSMSTISEESWKALVMSFNPSAVMALHETPGGDGPNADSDDGEGGPLTGVLSQEEIDQEIEELYMMLLDYVEESGAQDTISVTKGDGKIYITFNQTVFFDADSPVLREDAFPVLDSVCAMLDDAVEAIDEVRVLGHTAQASQERPNHVDVDRTLASNRATNVVIYVQEHSALDPGRLISEGIGQWRPIADNATPEGQAKNRRVEMIISGRNLEEELQEDMMYYEIESESGAGAQGETETGTEAETEAETGTN